jgi:hypothetical protein
MNRHTDRIDSRSEACWECLTVATEKTLRAKREKYEADLKTVQTERKKYKFSHSEYIKIQMSRTCLGSHVATKESAIAIQPIEDISDKLEGATVQIGKFTNGS